LGCLGFGLLLGIPANALAAAEAADTTEIVVTAQIERLKAVASERSLNSDDVEAYGLDTIGEVIDEITAEDGESRDDIIFLVNGKRVAGPGDVEDLPAEAIAAIDVLPPGTGVSVGGNPRQRVYNVQLRSKLDLTAAKAAERVATRGDWSSERGDISHTIIRGPRRITATAKVQQDALLRESERDVIQPAGAVPEAGELRSLAPDTDRLDLSFAAADRLASWLDGSLNAKLSTTERDALLGAFAPLGVAEQALDQQNSNFSFSTNAGFTGQFGSWSVNLLGNYGYLRRRTETDRAVTGEPEPLVSKTVSRMETLGGDISAFGPLVQLPAGPMVATFGAAIASDRIEGARIFRGIENNSITRQTTETLRADVEVPIASDAEGMLGFLGDLSASAELSRQHASDFGSVSSGTLTLLWRPASPLLLTASISRSDTPPPVASLDDPPIETPGTRYFDPLQGETVDVTMITGGIAGLRRQEDEEKRFIAKLKPLRSLGLQLTGEYRETSYRNEISELPSASLAVFDAFPERFIRNPAGQLIIVDSRPVQFASRERRQVRTGFMLSLPLGKARADAGGGGGGGGEEESDNAEATGKPKFGIRPRLQMNGSYSLLLDSELTMRAGQQPIDLLSRDAIGFGGLGQPRHRFDLTLGYAGRGLGLRTAMQYRSESFIEASGSTENVLRFEPLTTFTLRAWVQGERIDGGSSWLKGSRLSLAVTNLTDVRENVVDSFGATPLSYQPAYRDAIGRTVEIELRKKF
jgi:hypothetical protein